MSLAFDINTSKAVAGPILYTDFFNKHFYNSSCTIYTSVVHAFSANLLHIVLCIGPKDIYHNRQVRIHWI